MQTRLGQPFWDPAVPQSPFAAALPEPLRVQALGVQPTQAIVYEDFRMCSGHWINVYRTDYSSVVDTKRRSISISRPESSAAYARPDSVQPTLAIEQTGPVPLAHQEAIDRFNVSAFFVTSGVIFVLNVSLAYREGSRGRCRTVACAVAGRTTTHS